MNTINIEQFRAGFELLYRNCYNWGYFTKETIAGFVKLGTIGPDAYKRITGDDYHETTEPKINN